METQGMDRSQWQAASERLNSALVGKQAEVEVASLRLGDQIEADWTPVERIAYDPRDDRFHVVLDGVDHVVEHPRAFMVHEVGADIDSVAIVGPDGEEHIIKFRDPLALSAPGATRH